MEHTKVMVSVPLRHLVASTMNVRRHSAGAVDELAALIQAEGLLHNLVVTEEPVKRRRGASGAVTVAGGDQTVPTRFAVVAGERRRRALVLLQQRGVLPADHEVLCEVVSPERAMAVSLAENCGREALHPADEFEAFRALVRAGHSVEDVAARFGVSVLTVQRRLKLAGLSPRLVALYREGSIQLDQLMALTLSDDHAVQEHTWFDAQPWDRSAAAIRRQLTLGEVCCGEHALAQFVGVAAYEAAGGVVRRDLFDDEHSRLLSDPALLQRLAQQKLEAMAEAVRTEGWGWVEVRLALEHDGLRGFTRCEHGLRALTVDEQMVLAELDARADVLEQQQEALDDAPEPSPDALECVDLELQDIAARRQAIQEARKTWSPELMTRAGAIVTVTREGDGRVIRGLLREADRKALQSRRASDERGDEDQTGSHRDNVGRVSQEQAVGQGGEAVLPACSERLTRQLAAHHTAALQLMLMRQVPVALGALTHVLVQRVFGEPYPRVGCAVQVMPEVQWDALEAAAEDLASSPAWVAMAESKAVWRARLPAERGAWFEWVLGLPQDKLLQLLALCTAVTVNALPGQGGHAEALRLAEVTGLDMADWWQPTAQSYLNHVPKALIVQALTEAGAAPSASHLATMKKDALVTHVAAQLTGKRWLPAALKGRAAAAGT